jgi:PAS domain S-box-containing protein
VQEWIADVGFPPERLINKRVYFFIRSCLLSVEGKWDWPFQSQEIFCSDVLFCAGEKMVEGLPCLIDPEDFPAVERWLPGLQNESVQNFGFHVITSYGKREWLKLTGLVKITEEQDFFDRYRQQLLDAFIKNKRLTEEAQQQELYLKSYAFGESINATGMLMFNTVTHEAFYSNAVYRIHDLPPQSLKAHLYSFVSFVHPEDKDLFVAAFDKAYQGRTPLHVEYRLLLNNVRIKYVRLCTQWSQSSKGEYILSGIMEDLTAQKDTNSKLAEMSDLLKVKSGLLQQAETLNPTASWYMDMATKKVVYSTSFYRIFGVKQAELTPDPNQLLPNVHPDDLERVEAVISQALSERCSKEMAFRIVGYNGKIRYLKQKISFLNDCYPDQFLVGTITDVSKPEILERKLKKSLASLHLQSIVNRQLEEFSLGGSWLLDLTSGETTWSKGIYTLLGLKPSAHQLSQNLLLTFIHPQDKKTVSDYIKTVIDSRSEATFDFRVIRHAETRYLQAHFVVLDEEAEKLFSATIRDKTAEKQLQQQLQELLTMSDMLSDASMNKVFVCDRNNYLIRWNKRCEEAYGLKREKVLGQHFFDVFPQLKTPEILHLFELAGRGETVHLTGQKAILTGGYQDLLMVPVKDEKQIIRAILTVIQDTTHEVELQKKLTERLQFIEKLLEESVDRVIVLDRNMNYLYWNKRAEEYYRIRKEEVLGRNILDLFPAFINDPSYPEFRQALTGKTVFLPASETNGSDKDYFETYLVPFKDNNEEVTGILWIVHDLYKDRQLLLQQRKTYDIIDALNEGYYELDTGYRVKYINQSAEKFFNSSKDDIIEQVIWDAVPQAVGGPIHAVILKAMEQRVAIRGEYYSRSTGKWVYLSVTPTTDGLAVIFFDAQKQKDDAHFIHLIADTSPNMIGISSLAENKWIYINNATEDFFGYTNEEMNEMGEDLWTRLVHPDYVAIVKAFFRSVAAAQPTEIHEAHYRVLRKDGEYRWLYNRASVFKSDEHGRPVEILSIAFDNTEKVVAEEKLKESKDWLQSVLDNAGNSIMALKPVRNTAGKIMDLEYLFVNNKAAESVHRWDLVGKQMVQQFPGAWLSGLFDHYAQVVETGEPWEDECLYNYDGFRTWAHITCVKFGEGCLVTYEDVTERKSRELELRDTKDLLQTLFDASVNCIIAFDKDFRYVGWNARCEERYGLTRDDILGRSVFDFYPELQEDPRVMNAMQKALQGEKVHLEFHRELNSNRISERFFIPVKDDMGKVSLVLVLIHDITKMYEAGEELKRLNQMLEEKRWHTKGLE